MDTNTSALLTRVALDNFWSKSQLFGGKYLITTVKLGQNLVKV